MNISTRTIAGATATLALLLVATACGSETVSDTDPGTAPVANRIYPPTSIPTVPVVTKKGGVSADAAERAAAAEKARQDAASTARWNRGSQVENKLKHTGYSGRTVKKDGTDHLGQRSVPSFAVWCEGARCAQWVPARLRPTTPATISARLPAFTQVRCSHRNSSPTTATSAVPAPAHTAYAGGRRP